MTESDKKRETLKHIAQICINDRRLARAKSQSHEVVSVMMDAFKAYITEFPEEEDGQFFHELAQEVIPHCNEGICFFFLCEMLVSIANPKTGDVL